MQNTLKSTLTRCFVQTARNRRHLTYHQSQLGLSLSSAGYNAPIWFQLSSFHIIDTFGNKYSIFSAVSGRHLRVFKVNTGGGSGD